MRILVLCTGNSCRSQMAHGYFEHIGGSDVEVRSAGVETHGLNPMAVEAMAADGVDIRHHTSNHIDEYTYEQFDIVITVCDHANEVCPIFPGTAKRLHQNFKDPSKSENNPTNDMAAYVTTRDLIKAYVQGFLAGRASV